jgi:hypothetical protein
MNDSYLSEGGLMRGFWLVLGVCCGLAGNVALASDDFELPPINYSQSQPHNRVSRLIDDVEQGKKSLEYDNQFGYLKPLLDALEVPVSSQVLVFSKTSLQRQRIAPRTPRAIYFSDDVYVGYCHNGDVLEISAVDPQLGTVFYTIDQEPGEKPIFIRQTDNCMICHGSSQTQNVPGHVVRSIFSDRAGQPVLSAGSFRIDHSSPLEERWGGWYVSGTHGEMKHLGNMIVADKKNPRTENDAENLNLTDLGERFDRNAYLTPHSDIVALMVMEHQTMAHNLITRASYTARQAIHYQDSLNRELGKPADHVWDSTKSRIKSVGEPLVKCLLFSEEAPIKDRIVGVSGFAEEFVAKGTKDSQGRSLRELDLERRLFKYPCSYVIESEAFDALPPVMLEYVYRRLYEVLTGKDTSKDFAHLTSDDRQAILEILRATKKNLPDYFAEAK